MPRNDRPSGLRKRVRLSGWALRVPLRTLALYRIFKVEVQGRELVPKKGGALIASNHRSTIDAVYLFGALRRTVIMLAMQELWKNKYMVKFMNWFGHIAVDRGNRKSGDRVILLVKWVLERGGLVLWFPEGRCTRDGELGLFKPRLITFAYWTNTPVVPVGLQGTDGVLPLGTKFWRMNRNHPVKVTFMPALNPWDFATEEEFANVLRQRILNASTR